MQAKDRPREPSWRRRAVLCGLLIGSVGLLLTVLAPLMAHALGRS